MSSVVITPLFVPAAISQLGICLKFCFHTVQLVSFSSLSRGLGGLRMMAGDTFLKLEEPNCSSANKSLNAVSPGPDYWPKWLPSQCTYTFLAPCGLYDLL